MKNNEGISEEKLLELLDGRLKKDIRAIMEALNNFVQNHKGRYYCLLSIPEKYGRKDITVAGSMPEYEAFNRVTPDALIAMLKKKGYKVSEQK